MVAGRLRACGPTLVEMMGMETLRIIPNRRRENQLDRDKGGRAIVELGTDGESVDCMLKCMIKEFWKRDHVRIIK